MGCSIFAAPTALISDRTTGSIGAVRLHTTNSGERSSAAVGSLDTLNSDRVRSESDRIIIRSDRV